MDDEDSLRSCTEGQWKWDEETNELVFISNQPRESNVSILPSAQTYIGEVNFKEDIDPLEQERFKRRYCRKIAPDEPNIVTLQDIKDVVLFTAPKAVLIKEIIDILHLPQTERILRAMIFFCQYYFQVSDEMARRKMESRNKIRTANSVAAVTELKNNLATLRLLVAKEYCLMVLESEVHRLFRSEAFSPSAWKEDDKLEEFSPEEKLVLWGDKPTQYAKLKARSPLLYEVLGKTKKDYKMFGLGVIKYPRLNPRLTYLEQVISAREEQLSALGISLGIIGLPRDRFTVMLREIKRTSTSGKSTSVTNLRSKSRSWSTLKELERTKLYLDIVLPKAQDVNYKKYKLEEFLMKIKSQHVCNQAQYQKWLNRIIYNKCGTKINEDNFPICYSSTKGNWSPHF